MKQNIVLCWTDLETTGLTVDDDMVIEIAYQFTDYEGNPLSDVIAHNVIADEEMQVRLYEKFQSASTYVKLMHTTNGLWAEALHQSPDGRKTLSEVVEDMSVFTDTLGDCEIRIAGSSVHFDLGWILAETGTTSIPGFSHRVHDLSTIRPFMASQGISIDEICPIVRNDTHRAADDVRRDVTQWHALMEHLKVSDV